MTRRVDFCLEPDGFTAAAFEMAKLAQALPDGRQRLRDFDLRMRAAANLSDYLLRRSEIVDGLPAVVSEPGPKTLEFMTELRSAVAVRKGAA